MIRFTHILTKLFWPFVIVFSPTFVQVKTAATAAAGDLGEQRGRWSRTEEKQQKA